MAAEESLWDLKAVQYGEEVPLNRFSDEVVVIVNIASE